MKICTNCSLEKELTDFYKNKAQKDGYQNYCKLCMNKANNKWQRNNRETSKKYIDNWRNNNKEHVKKVARNWRQENKSTVASLRAKRRASELVRTPKWTNLEKIKAYYDVCSFFNEVNGHTKYHVDHIIPLQGKLVSGLHVENNLQVVSAKENLSKGNRI